MCVRVCACACVCVCMCVCDGGAVGVVVGGGAGPLQKLRVAFQKTLWWW